MYKYVLCRPRGGLNDTLCQIENCWNYCEKYNRILIIDTTRSGIFVEFSHLFENILENGFIFSLSTDLLNHINSLDCQIKQLEGKIDNYECVYDKEKNYILKENQQIIKFDFDKDYKESLLVYEQCGGGVESIKLLNKLRLSKELNNKFKKHKIYDSYFSIHVRNTDYKTDYMSLFEEIKNEVTNKKLLVCSDDPRVIENAKVFFTESIILPSTSNNFTERGKPLHTTFNNYSIEEKKILSENSVVDLLLLSGSEKIYYTKLSGYNFNKISGFTKLSILIQKDKKLLKKLID